MSVHRVSGSSAEATRPSEQSATADRPAPPWVRVGLTSLGVLLAALLMAAHHLRAGQLGLGGAWLALPLLLLYRRRWVGQVVAPSSSAAPDATTTSTANWAARARCGELALSASKRPPLRLRAAALRLSVIGLPSPAISAPMLTRSCNATPYRLALDFGIEGMDMQDPVALLDEGVTQRGRADLAHLVEQDTLSADAPRKVSDDTVSSSGLASQ